MEILWLLFLIAVAIVFLVKSYVSKEHQKTQKINQLQKTYDNVTELKSYISTFKEHRKLPVINTSLLLKKGEEAYAEENVKLFEIRTARKSDRLYLGGRVAKGVYVGGSSGVSRGFDELREIDNGKLTLTNKRVIFDGAYNTRSFDIGKIISVELYNDGIELSIEGKDKSQLYGGLKNPFLWKNLIHFIRHLPEDSSTLEIGQLNEMSQIENELIEIQRDLRVKLKKPRFTNKEDYDNWKANKLKE